ncbi:uncharacterized protein LOC105178744 [Sesamum indicum]|uniref:Uncharacterized protein LOC105178744 n=1 Tax=Sesamum indicum TaxID=4182 RepID=A0A6I9UGH2_SESIN|nr:uncharacterized protein LOC105178744 [Sesamum indicum]
MVRPVTAIEIKLALFDIAEDKAPGPDGYTSGFYKATWPIVGAELTHASIDFFTTGRLLKQLNTTYLTLIPKVHNPIFVLLHAELFSGYNQHQLPPRCALKVDIHKAYDTVDWDFLLATFQLFGFPNKLIRGLRQGDLMSPNLFFLIMEVLNLILQQLIDQDMNFAFHWKCAPLCLVQLGFADDLLLFSRSEVDSVHLLKRGLDYFGDMSSLRVNPQKSHLILSRAGHGIRDQLLEVLHFPNGFLPLKYLGLPLISSRLTIADCKPLLTKLDQRIKGWESISLSYVGRLQIIKSILTAFSVSMASAFILPKGVIREVERRLRAFLWQGYDGIWTTPEQGGSWGWHKLLLLRPLLRPFVEYQIGDGLPFYYGMILRMNWDHLSSNFHMATTSQMLHTLPHIHGDIDRISWRSQTGLLTSATLLQVFGTAGTKATSSDINILLPLLGETSSKRGSHTLWGVKSVRKERLLPSNDFKSALVGRRALLSIET